MVDIAPRFAPAAASDDLVESPQSRHIAVIHGQFGKSLFA